ncbi:hypothetical protein [Mycolicibacterium fluoranthenivorans]|uniref:hypothetical protein n=1 Tax=Mycolicibacterium fluoranthenivorans TaxID=258505 RepID=UPI001F313A16|nr:hypothetical protein [Mycolicibacterium fluoranthenivorans]
MRADLRAVRAVTAEVSPIMDADVPAVANFLRVNHNDRTPWSASCSELWHADRPNHGFMLSDGQRVVGVLLALYSERLVAGRLERFCNMGTWCVLPEYRSKSMTLVRTLLDQEGFHITVLSPNEGPQEILAWLKFRFLDTSAALIPNLPWPSLPGRTKISADPVVIERSLVGSALALYRDHALALAARHLVVTRGRESSHVMYREFRYKDALGYAMILYVSNPELIHRSLIPLTRHLLLSRGLVATLAELRIIERRPVLSFSLNNRPKMFRSASLGPEQIDYLYSELACVPW